MFQFKHFTIEDAESAMKIGTDGVLLGAWADVASDCRILDMGTGTGLIAIMAAQRNAEARIVAVDIVEDAVAEARSNVANTAWAERIEIPASITAVEFYRGLGYDFKGGIRELDGEGHYRLEKFRHRKA